MKYTCTASTTCTHYPRTEIPEGHEAWVRTYTGAAHTDVSRHEDCVAGLHYVARDGKRVSPYFLDENAAFKYLMKAQGMSVDWATRYEGWSFAVADEAHVKRTRASDQYER